MTIAVVTGHTISHLHARSVELTRSSNKDNVLAAFRAVPRIVFLRANEGIVGINSTLELLADLGRPCGNLSGGGLWEDSPTVKDNDVFFDYEVYNQAIVVPETIDSIHALTRLDPDGAASIAKTDKAIWLVREFLGQG